MTEPQERMGAFSIFPAEIRCQIWRAMWRSHAEDLEPFSIRLFFAPEHVLHSGIPFLRTCRAIYHEALCEIYDFSELVLRMDLSGHRPRWLFKDIRKLHTTYLTYIDNDMSASLAQFVSAHRRREHPKFPKIKVEISPPAPSDPIDAIQVRELVDDWMPDNILSESAAKIELIMLDTNDTSWSGFHVFTPTRSMEGLTVSDAKAILLSFCCFRNLLDVEIVLPKRLQDDKEMLDFASEMKKDLTSDRLTWRVERSDLVAKAESTWDPKDRWELKPSLVHQDMELSVRWQMYLDFFPSDDACQLREAKLDMMYDETYNHIDKWTRDMLQSKDSEIRHGIWSRVNRDDAELHLRHREMAAKIWFGARCDTNYGVPPLDLESSEWQRLLQSAIEEKSIERSDNFGSEAILDEEDIQEELLRDLGDVWDQTYNPVQWHEDDLLREKYGDKRPII